MRASWSSLGLALSMPLTSRAAHAQCENAAQAESLIAQGITARRAREEDTALARFEEAANLCPGARVTAQRGMAEHALGRWAACETHLTDALASDDAWVQTRQAQLREEQLACGEHLATLAVTVRGAPFAEVWIDGHRAGAWPELSRFRVPIGTTQLELRAQGFTSNRRIVDVRSPSPLEETSLTYREEVELLPEPAIAPPPPPPPQTPPPPPPPVVTAPRPRTQRDLGWVSLGLAGASVLTASAGAIVQQVALANYHGDARCEPTETDRATCDALFAPVNTGTGLLVGGAVGAALFLGVGIPLLLTSPRASQTTGFACAPGLLSAQCAVRF